MKSTSPTVTVVDRHLSSRPRDHARLEKPLGVGRLVLRTPGPWGPFAPITHIRGSQGAAHTGRGLSVTRDSQDGAGQRSSVPGESTPIHPASTRPRGHRRMERPLSRARITGGKRRRRDGTLLGF